MEFEYKCEAKKSYNIFSHHIFQVFVKSKEFKECFTSAEHRPGTEVFFLYIFNPPKEKVD